MLGFFGVHNVSAVNDVESQLGLAPDVFALPGRGQLLVADSFANDFAFELGERQQDVQRKPAHGSGGVELLSH